MDESTALVEQLDSCKYLFLENFRSDVDPMTLIVEVVEGRLQPDPVQILTGSTELDKALGIGRVISTRPEYHRFRVKFVDYLTFAITNESYAQPEKDEDYSKKLRKYDTSTFLEYIRASTWATQDYPGPFTHYALVCSDHVINVASGAPPHIERLPTLSGG